MQSPMRSGATRQARRRTQEERSTETRRKVIDAATALICENGFVPVTIGEVAGRAGVSRGALLHHFATRFDLLAAVIDHLSKTISSETIGLAEKLHGASHSLNERIDAAIRGYWKIYTSDAFLAVLNIFLGVKNDPPLYQALQRHMVTFYEMNDTMWLRVFADSKLSRKRLLAARRVLFGALRGLAIGQTLGTQPNTTQSEFQLIRDMFVAVLANPDHT